MIASKPNDIANPSAIFFPNVHMSWLLALHEARGSRLDHLQDGGEVKNGTYAVRQTRDLPHAPRLRMVGGERPLRDAHVGLELIEGQGDGSLTGRGHHPSR